MTVTIFIYLNIYFVVVHITPLNIGYIFLSPRHPAAQVHISCVGSGQGGVGRVVVTSAVEVREVRLADVGTLHF